jgi:hypothetical protein
MQAVAGEHDGGRRVLQRLQLAHDLLARVAEIDVFEIEVGVEADGLDDVLLVAPGAALQRADAEEQAATGLVPLLQERHDVRRQAGVHVTLASLLGIVAFVRERAYVDLLGRVPEHGLEKARSRHRRRASIRLRARQRADIPVRHPDYFQ